MNPDINLISKDKLKDVLITRTAIKTLKSTDIVEKVIDHSFKKAAKEFKLHKEIEISCFGIFKTRDKLLETETLRKSNLKNYYQSQLAEKKEQLTDRELSAIEQKIKSLTIEISLLNYKKNQD